MSDSNKLEKIEAKLDKIQEKIGSIDITLAAQHESLKLHIKRTNILENQLEPVKKHVNMVNGVLKFIGFIAIIAGIIESVVKIIYG